MINVIKQFDFHIDHRGREPGQARCRKGASPHPLPYRPDIDGLRAVAVLVVLIFHAKLGLFPGGFVGVDIFFVISGYLIASIILKEEVNGHFSLVRFYERRIRRIFPALFVVILFCVSVGACLLTPGDYLAFGRSAFAAMTFWSNFYFNRQGGYFAPAAETQPLLHTWSLGVEEQFYLIAPLVLLLLERRLRRWRALVFWTLFTASLGVSAWGVQMEASWAFFLPHSRAFELMCGVALAMGLAPKASGRANEALAAIGAAMIAFSIVFYKAHTPFPGFAALAPAVGAALLIHSTSREPTVVARLLSNRPVVYVGRISYSLYLWHWPLLAFAEYEFGQALNAWHRIALLAAAFGLAALSHRYVEQPARRAGPPLTRRLVFLGGAAAIVVTAAISQIIVKGDGLPGRLPAEAAELARTTLTRLDTSGLCGLGANVNKARAAGECFIGDQDAPVSRFALLGDSHGSAVAPLISRLAVEKGVKGYNIGQDGCPPLLGLEREGSSFRGCTFGGRAEAILADPNVTDIIIVGRWGLHAEGVASKNETARTRPFVEGDDAANRATFARVLRSTVEKIRVAGKRVIIIAPVPEFEFNVPAVLIKAAMRGDRADVVMPRVDFDRRQRGVLPVLAELSHSNGVRVIYPHTLLCDDRACRGSAGGRALYVDDDHLSPAGATFIEPLLRESMNEIGPSP